VSMPDTSPPAPHYTAGQIALIVFGVLLLLPGACSLLFAFGMILDILKGYFPSDFGLIFTLWLFTFAISALGIFMIRTARKGARQSS